MSSVSQLAYLGFEVSDLPAWERFATEMLGLAVSERRDDGSLVLRLDERAVRIALHPGELDDLAYLGFETADQPALEGLVKQLEAAGHAVSTAADATCEVRGMQRLVALEDPSGIPLEIGWGPRIAAAPFEPTLVSSGFVTDEGGVGHAVITARDKAASERFYLDALGMRLSDRIHQPLSPDFEVQIAFLHANFRHHSIAFANVPMPKRIHHFMLEVQDMDDVGFAFDRFRDGGVPIAQGLGRHPNDGMFSFYAVTPSGFQVEVGWGGVRVDDATWETTQYDRMSDWGHRPPAS